MDTICILSKSCQAGLETAVAHACYEGLEFVRNESRISSPSPSLNGISKAILAVVQRSITAFWRAQNNGGLILAVLPVEIFCAIFDYLPLGDTITASHVCHHWREILTTRPSIWSTVNCSLSGGLLTSLLERSCDADLDLEVCLTKSNWEEVLRCIGNHLHRCTRLTVRLSTYLPQTGYANALRRALCYPAPRLRVFKLFDIDNQLHGALDDSSLFGGIAPHLTLIKAHAHPRLFLAWAGDALKNVERLLLRPSGDFRDGFFQDLPELFNCLPKLAGLALELQSWNATTGSLGPQTQRLVLPARLEFFAIIACPGTFDPSVLLRRIRHQDAQRVTVLYNRDVESAHISSLIDVLNADCAGAARDELQLIAASHGHRVQVATSFEDQPGRYTIRCARPTPFRLEFLFATLAKLSLHERFFGRGVPLPPAPALETLSIHMAKGEKGAHDGIFFLRNDRERILVCPALKRLRFTGPSSLPPLHLDPALLCAFVERHLQLCAGNRPDLHLRRAWLLQNNAADVARLLGLVRDIEIDEIEPDVASGPNYETLLSWD